MRCSPDSAAPAAGSPSTTTASRPISSPWPKGSPPATCPAAPSSSASGSRATSTTTCWSAASPATPIRWSARRSSPPSRPCATKSSSSGRRRWGRSSRPRWPPSRALAPVHRRDARPRPALGVRALRRRARRQRTKPAAARRHGKLSASLRKHHLHMHKRDNLLYLAPPLVISEAELDAALLRLGRAARRGAGVSAARPRRQALRRRQRGADRPAARRDDHHVGRLRPLRQRRGLHRRDRRAAASRTSPSSATTAATRGKGLAVLLQNRQVPGSSAASWAATPISPSSTSPAR